MKSKVMKKFDRYSLFYNFFDYPVERWLFRHWRRYLLSDLKGKILEIGVGTGKNLRYYSRDAKVTGIDISIGMLNKAAKELARLQKPYVLKQMDAQDLKFDDDSFDHVIFTFLLCSVPEPIKTLHEAKRVSRGKIWMIEHVLSKNKFVAFLQHLHNPITTFFFGVNINRDTVGNVKKSGLSITKEKNLMSNDIFKFIYCEVKNNAGSNKEENNQG